MVIPQPFRNSTCKEQISTKLPGFLHRKSSTNSLILDINNQVFVVFVTSPFLKKNADQKNFDNLLFLPYKTQKSPLTFIFCKLYSNFKGP